MNWQEVLTILVPILGMVAWVYSRLEKRFEKVDERLEKIENAMHGLNNRLTRLEGRFDERGYWESREWHKTGTEDRK